MDENYTELEGDPAEWQMIAKAARLRAEQEAVTLPPLPDLKKETQPMLTYPRQTQSATWGLLAASIITLLGITTFLMLNLMPNYTSPMPAATIPLIQQEDEEEPLTAYDIISRDEDLTEYTALIDASAEHKTYLQSGEPVVVFAPQNGYVPYTDSLLEDTIIIPLNQWIATPFESTIERTYALAGGGVVNVISTSERTNFADSVILQSGYVAVSIPIAEFNFNVYAGDVLYSPSAEAYAEVLLISVMNEQTMVTLSILPEDAVRLTELMDDSESPQFTRTITFMEGEAGACGAVPILEPIDLTWTLPIENGIVDEEMIDSHTGIDFEAETGTPVYAVADGLVIYAGWNSYGYGNMIAILHGGHISVYAQLNEVNVACGETVTSGQTIGAVGSTGNSTGPHLHFEIRRVQVDGYTEPVDPESFLNFGD